MLIREVPIFVLSHKNSRVLEGGWWGGWCGAVHVCAGGGGGRLRGGEGRRRRVCGGGGGGSGVGGADGERETGDALSMHGSRKK